MFYKEIYITDANGDVIAHTGIQIPLTNNELRQLSKGGPVQKNIEDGESNNVYLGYGHPIILSDTFQGSFFVLTSIDDVDEPVRKIRDLLTLSAVGAFFYRSRDYILPCKENVRATTGDGTGDQRDSERELGCTCQ